MITLRNLIELFFNGNDDKIYIDVYEGDEFNQIFHDVRIINSALVPYYDREVIAFSDSYDTLLAVIIEKSECKHCEFCDLLNNRCLIDQSKCYVNKKCLHKDCKSYKRGEWCEQ